MTRLTHICAMLLGVLMAPPARASDVIIYTEHYPPYSEMGEAGEVTGMATALVKQVMEESGLDYEIKLVPWNRAYTLSMQLENVLVYSLLHTKSRAESFVWLAPVLESDLYLYGRTEDADKFDLEALKSGQIRAACVIGDIACSMLADLGVPADKIVLSPDTFRGEEKLVQMGRADVFIAQALYRPLRSDNAQTAEKTFQKYMKLNQTNRFCLAAGKQVRPEIIEAVGAAYARLKAKGLYHALDGNK